MFEALALEDLSNRVIQDLVDVRLPRALQPFLPESEQVGLNAYRPQHIGRKRQRERLQAVETGLWAGIAVAVAIGRWDLVASKADVSSWILVAACVVMCPWA